MAGKGGLRRVSVGFEGGQVLEVRIQDDQLKRLHKAVGGDGWHELSAEDGDVVLDLAKVVYVRTESDEHRVGFGS